MPCMVPQKPWIRGSGFSKQKPIAKQELPVSWGFKLLFPITEQETVRSLSEVWAWDESRLPLSDPELESKACSNSWGIPLGYILLPPIAEAVPKHHRPLWVVEEPSSAVKLGDSLEVKGEEMGGGYTLKRQKGLLFCFVFLVLVSEAVLGPRSKLYGVINCRGWRTLPIWKLHSTEYSSESAT